MRLRFFLSVVLIALLVGMAVATPAYAQTGGGEGGGDMGPFSNLYTFLKGLASNVWYFLVAATIILVAVGMMVHAATTAGGAVVGGRSVVQMGVVAILSVFLGAAVAFVLIPALINWLQGLVPKPPF